MDRIVAIAARLIGHPAERAEIRHPHGERLAGARHARREQGRFAQPRAQCVHNRLLRGAIVELGKVEQARRIFDHAPNMAHRARHFMPVFTRYLSGPT